MNSDELEHVRRLYDEQTVLIGQECVTVCDNRRGLREGTGDLLESAFVELAASLSPELSVEIGAHEASFSERLKARLPGVHALAFEANPYVYERFASALQQPAIGVDYRFSAICAHDGFAELRIPKMLTGDVLERIDVIASLRNWPGFADYETVVVPTLRIDTVLRSMPAGRSVTWIDAEGAQREIIAGGSDFFARVLAVYIEVEDQERWRGQPLYPEVVETLGRFSLVPVMRDNLARGQFNEIFVRNEAEILSAAVPSIVGYLDALRGLVTA